MQNNTTTGMFGYKAYRPFLIFTLLLITGVANGAFPEYRPYLMFTPLNIPARISTCHPDLLDLAKCVHRRIPVRVFSCYRTWKEQKELCRKGRSDACDYPGQSYHNRSPSEAMDMVPLEFDGGITWDDWQNLVIMVEEAVDCWNNEMEMDYDMTPGFYWDSIDDPYHFQLELS